MSILSYFPNRNRTLTSVGVDKFSKNVAVQSSDCTTSMSINRKTVAIKTTGRQRIIADHVTINVKVVFYNSNRR